MYADLYAFFVPDNDGTCRKGVFDALGRICYADQENLSASREHLRKNRNAGILFFHIYHYLIKGGFQYRNCLAHNGADNRGCRGNAGGAYPVRRYFC